MLRLLLKTLSVLLIARLIFQPLLPQDRVMTGGFWLEKFPQAQTLGTGVSRLSGWLVAPAGACLRLVSNDRPLLASWLPQASIPAMRKRLATPARRHLPPVLARQFANPAWDHVLPGVADFAAVLTLLVIIVLGSAIKPRRRRAVIARASRRRSGLLIPTLFFRVVWRRGEVHSRRAFLEKLNFEYAESRANEIPVALLIVEVSTPDARNSSRLEKRLRRKLASELPSGSAWCRFGQGEFAVWVPGPDQEQALNLAEILNATQIGGVSIGLCHVAPGFGVNRGLLDYQALIGVANERLKYARSQGGGVSSNYPAVQT